MKGQIIGYLVVLAAACGSLLGCDQQRATETTTATREEAPENAVVASDSASDAPVTVRIHGFENYSATDSAYAMTAAKVLEKLVNSEDFKQKLIHATFKGGENPLDVYKTLKQAHELVSPNAQATQDHVLDFWLRLDGTGLRCNGRSIGGDDNGGGFVNTCPNRVRCWAANNCVASLADHLLHEYMHHLGYKHKSKKVEPDVPYVVGDSVAYALLTDPHGPYKLRDCDDWPSNVGPCAH